MKKILLFVLCMSLVLCFNACSTNSTSTGSKQVSNTAESEALLKQYHAFIQKFDAADIANMRPDVTKLDKIQEDYQVINSLLSEAEAIETKMAAIAANNKNPQAQLQVKPYMSIISARVMTLKSNKALYQSMGAQ